MWINAEAATTQKTSRSTEIQDSDLRRVASAVTSLSTPQMTDSPFLKALGTPTIRTAPAQTGELAHFWHVTSASAGTKIKLLP